MKQRIADYLTDNTRYGSAYNWWERSPNASNANNFCNVNNNGNANANNANNANGLSPFGYLVLLLSRVRIVARVKFAL